MPQLRYAVNDAEAVMELLISAHHPPTDQIFLLKNCAVKDFEEKLTYVKSRVKTGDIVLVYFSGHGHTNRDRGGCLIFGDGVNDAECGGGIGGLSLSRLQNDLEMLANGGKVEVTLITDACRKDAEITKVGRNRTQKMLVEPWTGVYKLLSCAEGESSWEYHKLRQGLFTYHLTNGFWGLADGKGREGNKDKKVTIGESFHYAEAEVGDDLDADGRQTPQMVYKEGKEARFFTPIHSKKASEIIEKDGITVPRGPSGTQKGTASEQVPGVASFEQAIQAGNLIPTKYLEQQSQPSDIRVEQRKQLLADEQERVSITCLASAPGTSLVACGNFGGSLITRDWDTDDIRQFDPFSKGPIQEVVFADSAHILYALSSEGEIATIDLKKQEGNIWFYSGKKRLVRRMEDRWEDRDRDKLEKNREKVVLIESTEHGLLLGTSDGQLLLADPKGDYTYRKVAQPLKERIVYFQYHKQQQQVVCIGMSGAAKHVQVPDGKVESWGQSQVSLESRWKILTPNLGGFVGIRDKQILRYTKGDIQPTMTGNIAEHIAGIAVNLLGDHLLIISNEKDGSKLLLYNTIDGKLLHSMELPNLPEGVSEVQWIEDQQQLLIGGYYGGIYLYDINWMERYASDYYNYVQASSMSEQVKAEVKSLYYLELQRMGEDLMFDFLDGKPIMTSLNAFREAIFRLDSAKRLYSPDEVSSQHAQMKENFLRAWAIIQHNQVEYYASADSLLRDVIGSMPEAAFPHQALAMLERQRNDLDSAKVHLQAVSGKVSRWTEAKKEKGVISTTEKNHADAKREYKEITKVLPRNPKGFLLLGTWHQRRGRWKEIDSLYQMVDSLAQMRDSIQILAPSGNIRIDTFRVRKSWVNPWEQCDSLVATGAPVGEGSRVASFVSQLVDGDSSFYRDAPYLMQMLHQEAVFSFEREDYFEAENNWQACRVIAHAVDAPFPEAQIGLGRIYLRIYLDLTGFEDHLRRAVKYFEEASDVSPGSGVAHFLRAKWGEQLARLDSAQANSLSGQSIKRIDSAYQKAIKYGNQSPLYRLHYQRFQREKSTKVDSLGKLLKGIIDELGQSLVDSSAEFWYESAMLLQPYDPERSLTLARRALVLDSQDYRIHLLIWEISVQLEQPLDSLQLLYQRTHDLFPELPQPDYLMGSYHYQRENSRASAEYLQQALEIDDQFMPARILQRATIKASGASQNSRDWGLPTWLGVEPADDGTGIFLAYLKGDTLERGLLNMDMKIVSRMGDYHFEPVDSNSRVDIYPNLKILELKTAGGEVRQGLINLQTGERYGPVIFKQIGPAERSSTGESTVICRIRPRTPRDKAYDRAYFFTRGGDCYRNPSYLPCEDIEQEKQLVTPTPPR